ncbi:Putative restriction endonuclease [Desulfosporosinus hippei DSM 8344]|uniref:Putative restriction endonuclease n=1 Tax=Desulfosporosinus hippei DSM 8344 TaxID=1121419 RepID=A0A1G7U4B1_9FIRM|nr:Putative restriction endonuclease [Desulfosporosinus hippei DSM 8344]
MPLSNDVRKYTYADYLLFRDDERWEIIDGIPYMQSAPSWQHQSISRELLRQFANYMLAKPCEVFAAPFDLGLSEAGKEDKDITDVYQPDLVVICDKVLLKGTGYFGVPDLVIEIISPSTAKKDRLLKFNSMKNLELKSIGLLSRM